MTGGGQRIDKWLWHARFTRTRTLAQKLVSAGGVRINRLKVDAPAAIARPGDVLTIAAGNAVRVVRIAALADRRGPPEAAKLLYEDLTPPAPPAQAIPAGQFGPRPTKRDRRALDAFRRSSDEED
jgi:ribosome-associated heat shock protein Hsp15